MALFNCLACTTKFARDLLRCPHCGGEDYEEDGVAKIARNDGATDPEAEAVPDEAVPVPELEPVVLKTDLQDQARELGLPVSGTKAQLADAVAEAVAGVAEPEPELKAAPSLSKAKDE